MGAAPADFLDEVELAGVRAASGDLALLTEELRLFGPEWAAAGLRAIREARLRIEVGDRAPEPARVLAFTGHRIDAPDRAVPRFPATAEPQARSMIHESIAAELEGVEGEAIGYAGGASGGDILFHEACEALGIETFLLLAGPPDPYARASVRDGGSEWTRRFDRLAARLEPRTRILSDDLELPQWLRGAPGYSIWQRNNLWELETALAHGSSLSTLIALWDHQAGDGAGGTEDMVRIARGRGARTVILDARELVG